MLSDSSEIFRNDLTARLATLLSPDLLRDVLNAVDTVAADYAIHRRTVDLIPYGGPPQTVCWFLRAKELESASPKTVYRYQRDLINFFAFVQRPVQDVTSNDIRAYLAFRKSQHGVTDNTLDNYRRVLNSFFSWLVNNDYIAKNPVSKIQKIKYQEKPRVALTPIQLEQLRDNCRTQKERALVEFLYSTGCRVSECAAVALADISWAERSVLIRHGKGDKARTVFFSPRCEFHLRKYLENRKPGLQSLFAPDRRRDTGDFMSARGVQALIRKICSREPIGAKCTPHILRHTMATAGIRAGMPIQNMQALLGHAKPETTMIYTHMDKSDLQQAHSRAYAG